VARRIELPSAEELFGDSPRGGTAKPRKKVAKTSANSETSKPAPKKAAARATSKPRTAASRDTSAAAKRTTKSGVGTPTPKPAPARRRKSPEQRLAAIEARLASLAVESLIDLRDALEDLLASDRVDEESVDQLLDSLGA
jgi:hypothetical protein